MLKLYTKILKEILNEYIEEDYILLENQFLTRIRVQGTKEKYIMSWPI